MPGGDVQKLRLVQTEEAPWRVRRDLKEKKPKSPQKAPKKLKSPKETPEGSAELRGGPGDGLAKVAPLRPEAGLTQPVAWLQRGGAEMERVRRGPFVGAYRRAAVARATELNVVRPGGHKQRALMLSGFRDTGFALAAEPYYYHYDYDQHDYYQ